MQLQAPTVESPGHVLIGPRSYDVPPYSSVFVSGWMTNGDQLVREGVVRVDAWSRAEIARFTRRARTVRVWNRVVGWWKPKRPLEPVHFIVVSNMDLRGSAA